MGENYDLCYNGDDGYINRNCIIVGSVIIMIIYDYYYGGHRYHQQHSNGLKLMLMGRSRPPSALSIGPFPPLLVAIWDLSHAYSIKQSAKTLF